MRPEDRSGGRAELHRRDQAAVDPDLIVGTRSRSRTRPAVLALISAGGVAGTAVRYGVSRAVPVVPGTFPWATFAVNITGSFVLGVLLTFTVERWPPNLYVRPFAAVGFLGAFTTFSTYMTETALLVKGHAADLAMLYVASSLVLGVAAAYLGILVARGRHR